MVRKGQKSKASVANPSTTVRKTARKAKSEVKLSNGFKDSANEKVESKADVKTVENEVGDSSESSQEGTSAKEERNMTDTAEKKASAVMGDVSVDTPQVSRSRKRRTVMTDKNEPSTSTKVKKQKVVIEVPKISPISGKVFVIGDNGSGQLGFDEDVTEKRRPALLDLPYPIADIAAGAMHSVCLTANGEVITFGCNDEGALGRVTEEEADEFKPDRVHVDERIIQVSAGDSHSAALSESGHVYIWGNFRNKSGPMGLVTEGTKQNTPIRILNNITIVQISSGCDHLVCLSQDGVVYTCGNAEAGQLGRISEHSSEDGGRKGYALLLTPDKVSIASLSKAVVADNIWTGSYATFVKSKTCGSIYAFGLNNYEQLGLDNPSIHVDSGVEGPLETKPIYKPVKLTSFANRAWLQINGGLNHTLALDNNGVVYSLGRSEYGTLGLGEGSGDKSSPTTIPSLQDKKCAGISCGNSVSLAVTDTGSAFSWGFGTNHQLGHGDDSDQYTPKLIEGNFLNSWKALKIAGGGQHTLILAQPRETLEKSK